MKPKPLRKPDWNISEYDGLFRGKKKDIQRVRQIKGKKTIAGKLEEIIEFYFKYGPDKTERKPINNRKTQRTLEKERDEGV